MTKGNPVTGEIVPVGSTTPVWDEVRAATTHADRVAASRKALEMVTLPDLSKPVPMFMVDLPWAQDREAAQEEILARIIAADSLEAGLADENLVKLDEVVGHNIVIHSVVARPGTVDEGWGAYCSLDVTIDGKEDHKVVNTSSKEVCVVVWRAFVERRLPLTCHVILKGNPTPGRNQPVGLIPETPF